MKLLILLLGTLTVNIICRAQTWDEWFRQKKTQIKYLEEQIIALQVYSNYLHDGYNIVQGGLTAIHDIKNGDFNLHQDYFNSLSKINIAILNDDKTRAVIDLQLSIIQLNKVIDKHLNSSLIVASERLYAKEVMQNILQQGYDNLSELGNLTTNERLTMKDDERIKRINVIYRNMQEEYAFVMHLKDQVELLALSRQKEATNIEVSQTMYGIK